MDFIPAEERRNLERQKTLTFSFEDISLDITRQLISSKQFSKLQMLGRAIDIEDEKAVFNNCNKTCIPIKSDIETRKNKVKYIKFEINSYNEKIAKATLNHFLKDPHI